MVSDSCPVFGAMSVRRGVAVCLLALGLGAGLLAACDTLPSLEHRSPSTALLDTDTTQLGGAIAPRVDAHPRRSGIYPLPDGRDAFAARALLARAADRGVRVRLLLDNNRTSGLDTTLAALDAHVNIEVRLFNPFVVR